VCCEEERECEGGCSGVVIVGVVVKLRKLRDALDLNLRSGDFASYQIWKE